MGTVQRNKKKPRTNRSGRVDKKVLVENKHTLNTKMYNSPRGSRVNGENSFDYYARA